MVALAVAAASAHSAPSVLEQARQLYQQTKYQEAIRLLESGQGRTGADYELLGKCWYMLEEYKKATDALEKATAAEARNADYWDWLGKAYGRRAETSSFLTALSYASKTRQYFERAVELDPQNLEALDDLFSYYLDAPGFLGGGVDKAAAFTERVRALDAAKYHAMQARLAEKRKQFDPAEQFWRKAAELAPSQVGRVVDLAKFFARQGRFAESEAALERAAKMAPDKPSLKFEQARVYIRAARNPELARKLLQEYLEASLTPDDPPRSEAQRLLKSLGSKG